MGSDHDLVILNFRVRLKNIKKPKNTRLKFDLDKLKDPSIAESFQAKIGGRFAALLTLEEDAETTTNKVNETMIEVANEVLGKHHQKTQPWVTDEILGMCDERRDLKKVKNTVTGAAAYKEVSKKIRRGMKKAKEEWIEKQCTEIEESLNKNNSKKAYQVIKNLTKQKQSRVSTIQDKEGNCLTEEKEIIDRWTEYCSDLYNNQTLGDTEVLTCQESSNDDDLPILREEVEAAIKSLKNGKAAGADNIPAELIKHGGEAMTDVLTKICNKIWQ
jgi:hypothetical protein